MNKPAFDEAPTKPHFAAGPFCSYTNDPARAAETCQAALEAKNASAEQKLKLPDSRCS
jgi:hypothetical protein